MQELMLKSKQFDLTEQDPAKKGIPIIVMKLSDAIRFACNNCYQKMGNWDRDPVYYRKGELDI